MLKPKATLHKTARVFAAASLAAVCALGMTGCDLSEDDLQNMTEADVKAAIEGFFADLESGALFSGATASDGSFTQASTDGFAAIVNGTEISQQEVTNYIQSFREYSGLTDEATFASWMQAYGYTPDTLWQETVDIFINQELIRQAAAELDIEISPAEVTATIETVKSDMDVSSDEEWESLLADNGLTEQSYRDQIELSLTEEAIMEKVSGDAEVTDEAILTYFQNYDENYMGATSVDDIDPADIESASSDLQNYAKSLAYYDYMDAFSAAANIELGQMPENAPYNIDLSAYEDTSASAATPSVQAR